MNICKNCGKEFPETNWKSSCANCSHYSKCLIVQNNEQPEFCCNECFKDFQSKKTANHIKEEIDKEFIKELKR